MEEKKDFRKPGRGGFSQRRGYYGNTRGFNSKNFGGHTWTFYEQEQWESFQNWMKDEKEKKKLEETKYLLKGVDELMKRCLGKRKDRQSKKERLETSSDSSDDESRDSSDKEENKRSERKKEIQKS